MKIKIKENIVGKEFSYIINQIVNVKKELAFDLIKAGHAEEVKIFKKSGDK